MSSEPTVSLSVDRGKALTRALLWGAVGVIILAPSAAILLSLDFTPSGVSNRIVELSLGVLLALFVIGSIPCVVYSLRWFLLAAWPGELVMIADADKFAMRLGSFGIREYHTKLIEVRYLFESAGEEGEGQYEAFMPEEQQRRTLLPRMTYPGSRVSIDREILRFANGSEAELAGRLRPLIEQWRAAQSAVDREAVPSSPPPLPRGD